MDNQKYLNYYVEILTNTLTDAVIRNVSLQANARVSEDVINDQVKRNEDLNNQINNLKIELIALNQMKNEYENVKHQANHIDTFRNELLKEREEHEKTKSEIKRLNEKIEYLESPLIKRKKIENEKNKVLEVIEKASVLPLIDETIKDGGSF